jgi:hypothetical protein
LVISLTSIGFATINLCVPRVVQATGWRFSRNVSNHG